MNKALPELDKDHLIEGHKDLHQWFLFHQESLILGIHLPEANELSQQAFSAFQDYLSRHIEFENRTLLDAHAIDENKLTWPLKIYRKEHDKLLLNSEKLAIMLKAYYEMPARPKRLALLELLAFEHRLKELMLHHEQREEQDLLLHADGLTAPWQAINLTLTQRYAELKQSLNQLLSAQ